MGNIDKFMTREQYIENKRMNISDTPLLVIYKRGKLLDEKGNELSEYYLPKKRPPQNTILTVFHGGNGKYFLQKEKAYNNLKKYEHLLVDWNYGNEEMKKLEERINQSGVDSLTPDEIYAFGSWWQGGHRDSRLGNEMPAWKIKLSIIRKLESVAQKLGWNFGIREDEKTINFPWIFYIDSPCGQASFHLNNYDRKKMLFPDKPFSGEWNGQKTSWEVVKKIWEKFIKKEE